MKRVVVLGLMGQYPLGGMAWQVLHHLIGLRRLGFECFYVEDSGAPPYSPREQAVVGSTRENVRFLRETFRRYDLADAWSYYDSLTRRWFGMRPARVRELFEHADAIVNLCGASRPDREGRHKGCLIYIETDPILEQVKYAQGDAVTRDFLHAHDVHFTYGWNIGEPGCRVPAGDIAWRKTHPPVVVDLWESAPKPRGNWRTIATYHNKGKDVVLGGETYHWSKHPNFARVMDLPSLTKERLEVALSSYSTEVREQFLAQGWKLEDPYRISHGAGVYRRYIQGAKGEFSVEKEDQTRLKVGWFSDRSVCFLGAGRPCVLQDTGFGARVPTGTGLLAWSTAEEAVEALERVARDYTRHAAQALAIAREYFDASVLLPPVLEAAGV
ncbi:MAG TPA: hypothetical protein VKE73_16545 [Myxococcota bacterium]|nr:hypothetical protein [Myxococcota bacterium]